MIRLALEVATVSTKSFDKKKMATTFLVGILIVMVGLSLLPIECSLTVDIVNPSRNDVLQVLYDIGNGFNEADSKRISLQVVAMNAQDAAISNISVPLPAKQINNIVIIMGMGPKTWNLKNILLESKLAGIVLRSHTWLPEDIVRDFTPLNANDTFSVQNKQLFFNVSGYNPYFGYKEDFRKVQNPMLAIARQVKVAIWVVVAFFAVFLLLLNRRLAFEILKKLICSTKQLLVPFPESCWIFPAWFWGVLAILAMLKLWLVSAHAFPAAFYPHDDLLFLRLAQDIASGEWLGEYNNLTLFKQPFYPIWIAAMFWLGVPLSLSQHILYGCSCLVFVIAIRQMLRNNPLYLLIIFATLLFHPVSYAGSEMSRVLREGVYLSLPLLVLSFAIGLLLRRDATIKKFVMWNICLSLSFTAFWLTREEGVILLPSLFLLFATLLVSVRLFSQEKKRRIKVCCIAIVLVFVIVGAIAGINKVYYGIFATCEQTQSYFGDTFCALYRVKPKAFQRYLLVSHEMRERIYMVSPAFAELRPFLEGDLGKAWAQFGPYAGKEITGHFIHALMDSVALAGYYRSGDVVAKYYQRLTLEVNTACDAGTLECYKKSIFFIPKSSYMAGWHNEYLGEFLSTFVKLLVSMAKLDGISMTPRMESAAIDDVQRIYQDITRDSITPTHNNPFPFKSQQKVGALKTNILEGFIFIFRFYSPALVILGLLSYFFHLNLILKKQKIDFPFIIVTALLGAVIARIFLLSLIEVTLVPDFSFIYRTSAFPLLVAFSLLSIITLFMEKSKIDDVQTTPNRNSKHRA
jgi:hypothetical protein